MSRVVAFIPDLLFGSRVQADLQGAGHEVELVNERGAVIERLARADVLVVDLTDDTYGGLDLVEGFAGKGRDGAALERPSMPRTLGFYSHVEIATRQRAEQAGFDLVVPRSRMAREGATLVGRLAIRR